MAQVLHLANGDTVNQKLRSAGSVVEQVVKANNSDEKVVDEAYLATLCRQPTEGERAALLKVLSEAKENRREAIEDLYWSLLSSKEFLFNR
jgi:hypothetical protein